MSLRRTVTVDLRWSERSPLVKCFENPKEDRFVSDWVPVDPPLPHASILSQSVVHFDILPSPHDNVQRWSYAAETNPDGSAVRVTVHRRCGTKPNGLVVKIVLDNMESQMDHLMDLVEQLKADNARLRSQSERHQNIVYQNNNRLQEYTCDLHGTTIGDGMANSFINKAWDTVNTLVQETKSDWKLKVMFGAGNRNPNVGQPPRMKGCVTNWFEAKQLLYHFDGPFVCHVIHYRGAPAPK